MFWALAEGAIDTRGFEFEHVLRDIQTLNEWALEGRLEVTAISLHAYPFVQERYALLPHGASMGSGYGPIVVSREPMTKDELREVEIAVPGEMTTAFLVLRMVLGDFRYRVVPFDQILDAVRTPIGRYGGALAEVRPDDLAATAIAAAVERSGVPAGEIEDVWFGCANQAGEDNRNVARMAALLAGLPESVAGVTVNRLCASGLSAIVGACHAVVAGDGDLFVAGGVESMSRAPLVMAKPERAFQRGNQTVWDTTLGWRFPNPRMEAMFPLESMGETGENVAERWGVTREDQDAFALESQRRWAVADEAGRFADELVPVGDVTRDEHPRPDTTAEKLAALKPAFREGGTVTAGNASGINDGAAALVIASEERA